MLRKIFILGILCLLSLTSLVMAEEQSESSTSVPEKKFYKKIGPDGQVIYTDKPVKDSTEIKVPKSTTYKPVVTPGFTPQQGEPEARVFEYESLIINSPSQKETIWSNEGKLEVSVSLEPTLRINHRVIVSVDGKVQASGKSLTVSLANIDPGEHELTIDIQDTNGRSLKSESAIFYMRHHLIKK